MKKFLQIFLFSAILLVGLSKESHAQLPSGNYSGYLGALDTLTNADTTTYTVNITGNRHCITFSTKVTKISGTVAGTIKIYGSSDGGVTYLTTPLTTINLTDASANLGVSYTSNGYDYYKVQLISSGTCSLSQRTSLLTRKL